MLRVALQRPPPTRGNATARLQAFSAPRCPDIYRDEPIDRWSIYYLAWARVLEAYVGNDYPLFWHTTNGEKPASLSLAAVDLSTNRTCLEHLKLITAECCNSTSAADASRQASSPDATTRANSVLRCFDHSQPSLLVTSEVSHGHPFAVVLNVHVMDSEVQVLLEYSLDVLDADSASNVLATMQSVLLAIPQHMDKNVNQLDKLSKRDHDQIAAWTATERLPVFIDGLLHDHVLRQGLLQPESEAVAAWDGTFTYAQLSNAAEVMASHLRDMTPNAVVAICLDKSCWVPVTMIAVLRSNAAFVMLSPSLPDQRLLTMTRISGAVAVITSSNFRDRFASCGARVLVDPPTLCQTRHSLSSSTF